MGFVHDNNLKAGDVCVFVLINNNIKPLIDVVYFRTTEAENCTTDGEQIEPEMKETDEDDDSDSGYDPNDESNEDSSNDPSDDTFSHSKDFDDDSDDDSSETPESFTSYQRKTREKSLLTSPQPCKEKGTISSGKAEPTSTTQCSSTS